MSSSDDTIVVLANLAKVNPDAALNALRGSKYKDGSELAVFANLAKVNRDAALTALLGYASSKKAHYSRLGGNRQRKSTDTVTPEVPVEVPVTPTPHSQRMSCWIKTCNRKCGRLHDGDDGWVPPPLCRNGEDCPTKDDPIHPCMFRHSFDKKSTNPVSHDDRKPKDLDVPLDWPSVRNAIGENSKQQKVTQEKLAETQEELAKTQEELAATQKKLAEMTSQFEALRQGNIDLEEQLESLYELTQDLINKVF